MERQQVEAAEQARIEKERLEWEMREMERINAEE